MKILIAHGGSVASTIKSKLNIEKLEVYTATDGEAGFKLAMENQFELIVLESKLPGKDGLSMLKDLRARNNQTPVLVLGPSNSSNDIANGFDSGADAFLSVPWVFPELLARVRALLRRSDWSRGANLSFAGLRLDPVAHRVWCKNVEMPLSAKEYRFLEHFMRHPRQVMTKEAIARKCAAETSVFTNGLYRLKQKVQRYADSKLIHNVRGVGYILCEEEGAPVLLARSGQTRWLRYS